MSEANLASRNQFIKKSAEILDCMANANRMSILTILLDGEISVGSLSMLIGLSQSALSQHLAKLRRAKLVSFRREAQTIYYSCDSDIVKRVLAMMNMMFPPSSKPAQAA